jgi:hypothetical protein
MGSFELRISNFGSKKRQNFGHKKWVSYFYRAAQLSTLAAFPPWGSSRGAGRKRLTRRKYRKTFALRLTKC